ncbi:MAG: F0F1 ATP synthase subunit A [Nocardioidaceae bacterium]|nr:F0F1 ATP synthase subunit A [Nocardioidaceae bacterium]
MTGPLTGLLTAPLVGQIFAAEGSGSESDTQIKIGEHVERHFLGMTFNIDTIISTLVAGGLVLILAFVARRALTKPGAGHVPTKTQLIWETVVKEVNTQVEDNLGRVHPFVVPLAVALFFFILIANWLELIPTELNHETHLLPAPTADTNLTYAMALLVMFGVWGFGIRERGAKAYFRHFIEPFPVMLPLNVLEELTKPITLALRLFGNIFAGGIMLAVIGLIPLYALWAPNLVWKLFDMFIGLIQAFIFALLTVLYFGMAAGGGHGDEHAEDHADDGEHKETSVPREDADTESRSEDKEPALAQ